MNIRFQLGAVTAASVFAVFYLMAGFVFWDFAWLSDIASWRTDQRFAFLYMMGLVPAIIGVAVGSVAPKGFVESLRAKTANSPDRSI